MENLEAERMDDKIEREREERGMNERMAQERTWDSKLDNKIGGMKESWWNVSSNFTTAMEEWNVWKICFWHVYRDARYLETRAEIEEIRGVE